MTATIEPGSLDQRLMGRRVTVHRMKRFLRVLAVVGGLAGLAWAMRDRLISISATREEQPPTFRVVSSDGHAERSAQPR
jgi:hypothetical protein